MSRQRVVVGLVAALVLAGCSSESPRVEGPPSSTGPARVEEAKDRDETTVMAALRQLDLCAVLRPAYGDLPAADPFSCGRSGLDSAVVSIVQLDTKARLALAMRVIGTTKAYVDGSRQDTCRAYFPVSFELAVRFDLAGKCGPATDEFLAAAAVTLTEPSAVTAPHWDACTALAEVLDDDAGLMVASAGVGAACERWEPSLARLELRYGNPLIGATTTEIVGDVQVETQEDDSTGRTVCWVAWRTGTTEPALWATVAAEDCGQAKTLARSVMAVLGSPPPDVTPQRPLLYGADEPDTPFVGACAHLEQNIAKHCRPFKETSVRNGTAAILRAAATDAGTACAVARDAITRHFGAQLIPVTADDGTNRWCYFVEPERQLQIEFQIGLSSVKGVPDLHQVRDAEIAGLPAYVEDVPNPQAHRLWVGVASDPSKDGTLDLTVRGGPANRVFAPSTDIATKAEQAVTDILDGYFT